MAAIEGKGIKIVGKERKPRSDKKVRVCPYFEQSDFDRLNRLARICNVTPPILVLNIMKHLISKEDTLNWIMDFHRVSKNDPLRLTPTKIDGKLFF